MCKCLHVHSYIAHMLLHRIVHVFYTHDTAHDTASLQIAQLLVTEELKEGNQGMCFAFLVRFFNYEQLQC